MMTMADVYLYRTLIFITKSNQHKTAFPDPLSALTPVY